jgi:site-specific DNA-methyltransferase (adenine-specific)
MQWGLKFVYILKKGLDKIFGNRNCIGVELNPEYVVLTKERLKQPFNGFDSIDDRMGRIPNDLNDIQIRAEYLNNHKTWFLKYHPNFVESFENEIESKYLRKSNILELFDNIE